MAAEFEAMGRIGAAVAGVLLLGLGSTGVAHAHDGGWGGHDGDRVRHHGGRHHRGWPALADGSCPGPYIGRGLVYNVPPCPAWASERAVIRARY